MSLLDKTIDGAEIPDDLKRRTRQLSLALQPIITDLFALYGVDAGLNALLTLYIQIGLYAVGQLQMQRVADKFPDLVSDYALALAEPHGNG